MSEGKPSKPLLAEVERVLGVTNEQLAYCRQMELILAGLLIFLEK